MNLPIICTLTEDELRERRQTVLESIRRAAVGITSLPDGYSYSFEVSSEVITQLSCLVDLERQCCPFLTFRIIVECAGQPVRLEIAGPPEQNHSSRTSSEVRQQLYTDGWSVKGTIRDGTGTLNGFCSRSKLRQTSQFPRDGGTSHSNDESPVRCQKPHGLR